MAPRQPTARFRNLPRNFYGRPVLPVDVVKTRLGDLGVAAKDMQTQIRVYYFYPFGWYATCAANERVYIFSSYMGEVTAFIEPVRGIGENGALIIDPELLREIIPGIETYGREKKAEPGSTS